MCAIRSEVFDMSGEADIARKQQNLLIINVPAASDTPLGNFLSSHEYAITPSDGKSCSEQIEYEISLRKDTPGEIRTIIYAGEPGNPSEAAIGDIRAADFLPMNIDSRLQVYFFSSYQGKFIVDWARIHGLSPECVHGLKVRSYSYSAFLHISELLSLGLSAEVVWLKHLVHCYTGSLMDKIKISKEKTLRELIFKD